MTTLAHISDLHFGREDPALTEALLSTLLARKPDILIVSGDFTQRAKKRQFRAARAFLHALAPIPRLIVPGNHDVSTTNFFERAARPLRRYRRYLTCDLEPFLETPDVAIAGINTVRVLATKDGRINLPTAARACEKLAATPEQTIRIVVTHHPMDLPAADTRNALVTRASRAMQLFARARVDLFLSGHLHSGLAFTTTARYPIANFAAVVAHAGTAISTRTRNEPNTWNLITLAPDSIAVEQQSWSGTAYLAAGTTRFTREPAGWTASSR